MREKNGLVLVWHDPEGNPPDFEIEMLEEYGTPGWSDWHFHKMELGVHPREIIENIADRAHFVYVHGFDEVTEFKNEFYRHMATQYMAGKSEHGNKQVGGHLLRTGLPNHLDVQRHLPQPPSECAHTGG